MNTQNKASWEEEFYELMQIYRHTPITKQGDVIEAYEDVKDYIKKNFVHKDEVKDKHNCKREGCIPIEEVIEDVSGSGVHRYTVNGSVCKYCGKLV